MPALSRLRLARQEHRECAISGRVDPDVLGGVVGARLGRRRDADLSLHLDGEAGGFGVLQAFRHIQREAERVGGIGDWSAAPLMNAPWPRHQVPAVPAPTGSASGTLRSGLNGRVTGARRGSPTRRGSAGRQRRRARALAGRRMLDGGHPGDAMPSASERASGGVGVVRCRVVGQIGVLAGVREAVAAHPALLLVEGDRALEGERPHRWRSAKQLGQAL